MSRIRAKICGLSTPAALDAAIGGGAAWVGFVFFPKSPRNLSPAAAAALVRAVPDSVGTVGVFVDPDDALVAEAARAGLTALQLHGRESPERLAALRRFGLELWKAIPVRTRTDLDVARAYRGVADRILYDAKTPPGTLPGGMGMRFDWRLLAQGGGGFDHPLPWLLSGGLDAGNLDEAVGITGARAIDVSSGVESAPGVKDVDKVVAFLQAASQL